MHELLSLVAAGVALALLAASAVWAARGPRTPRLAAFAAAGLLWLLANNPVEGAVLLVVTADHGLTVADLLLPVAACPVLAAWVRQRRARDARA